MKMNWKKKKKKRMGVFKTQVSYLICKCTFFDLRKVAILTMGVLLGDRFMSDPKGKGNRWWFIIDFHRMNALRKGSTVKNRLRTSVHTGYRTRDSLIIRENYYHAFTRDSSTIIIILYVSTQQKNYANLINLVLIPEKWNMHLINIRACLKSLIEF